MIRCRTLQSLASSVADLNQSTLRATASAPMDTVLFHMAADQSPILDAELHRWWLRGCWVVLMFAGAETAWQG